jgi:hypothetical protein
MILGAVRHEHGRAIALKPSSIRGGDPEVSIRRGEQGNILLRQIDGSIAAGGSHRHLQDHPSGTGGNVQRWGHKQGNAAVGPWQVLSRQKDPDTRGEIDK